MFIRQPSPYTWAKARARTRAHTQGPHPAPFSPASQHDQCLLPVSLNPPTSVSPHLVILQPFPLPLRRFLLLMVHPHLLLQTPHTLVFSPHFCPLKGPASTSNSICSRQHLSSLHFLPVTQCLLLMPHM